MLAYLRRHIQTLESFQKVTSNSMIIKLYRQFYTFLSNIFKRREYGTYVHLAIYVPTFDSLCITCSENHASKHQRSAKNSRHERESRFHDGKRIKGGYWESTISRDTFAAMRGIETVPVQLRFIERGGPRVCAA